MTFVFENLFWICEGLVSGSEPQRTQQRKLMTCVFENLWICERLVSGSGPQGVCASLCVYDFASQKGTD